MATCPEDTIIRAGDYDEDDVRWWIKHGDDPGHIQEIHELAESLGWFIWAISLPDETAGGDFFCDTYYRLMDAEQKQDLEDVLGVDMGIFDEDTIKGLLAFFEPYLRKMKEEQDANP